MHDAHPTPCDAHDWHLRNVGTFDVLNHAPCTCSPKDRKLPGKKRRAARKAGRA